MKRLLPWLAAAGVVAACSSTSTGVDPDAIDGLEKSAVQAALNTALAKDTLYPTLALLVFPYIDRASRIAGAGGNTTRIVGIQLDINATQGGNQVMAQLSAILAWNGYRATSRTVDTVVFVIGAGLTPPVNDSLRTRFSPDTAGTATGFVIHQTADSAITAWLARTGALHITSNSYGSGTTRTSGGLTLTARRGTLAGDYHTTAKLIPDSTTQVTSQANLAGGIQALKIEISGGLP